MNRAAGAGGRMRIVSDHDDRLSLITIQSLEQAQNFITGFAVEIARRLIAKEQRRIRDNGASDPDTLLFPTRKLSREMSGAVLQTDDFQRGLNVLPPLPLREMRKQQRQLDIALRAEHGEQIIELKDQSDMPRAPRGELPIRELIDPILSDPDLSAIGPIQAPDQVEQRRFARTGRAHQREEFSRLHFQIKPCENVNFL